jgi:alcohol dehydrogenase class IV
VIIMQTFYLPTEIITGRGCVAQLGHTAARYGQSVLIVCDANLARQSDLLSHAVALLQAEKLQVAVYDGVTREPELPIVEEAISLARSHGVNVFVGIGGGSAIDTAKAAAGMAPLPGSVRDYHGGRALEGPGLPFIAVPTTAGTGAEVTKNAVLIDPQTGIKQSIRDNSWFARVALVDAETTVTMPPSVTASTGSDALCQAIESYTSIGAGPLTDALAMRAIELVSGSLTRAYEDGRDLAAREAMSMGSLMAGMALVNARLGAVHGLAHPLGSHFHIPHGIICGLLLPPVMAYNLPAVGIKYAEVARLMGEPVQGRSTEDAACRAVESVRELVTRVGVPLHLSQFGLRAEDFDGIIAEALTQSSLKSNPLKLAGEDVRRILETAL